MTRRRHSRGINPFGTTEEYNGRFAFHTGGSMSVDKSLPHCWKLSFCSCSASDYSQARIDKAEAIEFHTEQEALDSADFMRERRDMYFSVYCMQKGAEQ